MVDEEETPSVSSSAQDEKDGNIPILLLDNFVIFNVMTFALVPIELVVTALTEQDEEEDLDFGAAGEAEPILDETFLVDHADSNQSDLILSRPLIIPGIVDINTHHLERQVLDP